MLKTPITVRSLGPDEAHILEKVRAGLCENLDLTRAWALVATRINELVVALDQGEVIGLAYGTMVMHPERPSEFLVSAVTVHENYRRQGIGTRLVERLVDAGADRGCEAVWMLQEDENEAAAAFCESVGLSRDALHVHRRSV